VSCTNRKRFAGPPATAVHEIGGKNLPERLKLWKNNLRSAATEEHRADDLYMGDHWSVVRSIPGEAGKSGVQVQLWICSAGYGLIRQQTPIKPYRATFTRGEIDYIASGLVENQHTLHDWWAGVCAYRSSALDGTPRTLSALAATFPRTPMLVALSADYLKAVTADLGSVLSRAFFRDHLSIISCGTSSNHSIWKQQLLPCDASLSGSLGGTLTSLNARVARRLLQSVNRRALTVDQLGELSRTIDRGPRRLAPLRTAKSDSDVEAFIRAHLAEYPTTSKTKLLQDFRINGHACEQKRFGEIYSRVRHEPLLGTNA
jgi:hypothetical protein